MASARLAIDLGTSHTVGVVHREGQQVRPLVFDGSPLLPSGVAIADDGGLVTGRDAERIAQIWPDRYEPHPKRRVDEGSVLLGDRVFSVAELLAAVLRRVVAEAGPAAANAVLTCPADWGGPRRDVLREAARQAGLGVAGAVAVVDEPVAAAAYCMAVAGQRLYVGQALAVFDFGGGTLDVTVVRRDADQLRVLATGGLDDLGGLDIDAAVVGHLGHLIELRDPHLWRRLESPVDAAQARDRRTFWTEVRAAKEMLSRTSAAPVQVPGRPDALHLTRDELERIAGPLIARAVDETRRVIARAGLATGSLAGVLLVGGSSRIPLVASRLHARLGVAPTMPEQPELPVAHGALLVGGAAAAPGAPGTPGVPGGLNAPGVPPRRPAPTSPAGWGGTSDTVSGSPLFGSPGGGPVSTPPYAAGGSPIGSPAGAPPRSAPPGSPAPGPPPPPGAPGGPSWTGQPPQPWAPRPAPPKRKRSAKRGAAVGMLTTLVIVAMVVSGVVWLGRKLTGSIGDFGSGTNAQDSIFGNSDGADGELEQVHDVALPAGGGAGAVATNGTTAFYAASGADTTTVAALPMAGGKARWTTSVPFGAAELRLTLVGSVLVLDGDRSTPNGDDARAVLDAGTGRMLWRKAWKERTDLAYVGNDVIYQQTDDPIAVSRLDLRTNKIRWTVRGPQFAAITSDERLATAARIWPSGPAPKPTDPVPPPSPKGIRETLRAGADVVMLEESEERGRVIDGRTGDVKRSARLPLDYDAWTVYEGLVVGLVSGGGGASVEAYKLSDLKRAWTYKLTAGSSVDAVRPCGPKRVCVVADPPSGGDTFVRAVDTTTGKEAWIHQAPSDLIDVGWYVVDGRLVLGEEWSGSIGQASVLDTNGKVVRENKDRAAAVLSTDGGGRAVMQNVRVGGEVVWQVLVGHLGSGDTTGAVDVGVDQPAGTALAGDSLVVLSGGGSPHVRVYRVTLG